MKIKVLKNGNENNICQPAKEGDLGYDLIAKSIKIVGDRTLYVKEKDDLASEFSYVDYIEYDTGIALEPSDNTFFAQVKPRSSLSKYNLAQCNSVATIDIGYRGTILIRFKYLFQPEDLLMTSHLGIVGRINPNKIYQVGDKIGQVVFANAILPEIEYVSELSGSERKDAGFGSTGA